MKNRKKVKTSKKLVINHAHYYLKGIQPIIIIDNLYVYFSVHLSLFSFFWISLFICKSIQEKNLLLTLIVNFKLNCQRYNTLDNIEITY